MNALCVPYYNCEDIDGTGIFNIRSNVNENVLDCESLHTCCEEQHILKETPTFEVCV